jgi:hypothetical protein
LQPGDVTISPKSSLCRPAMWQSHRNHRFAARRCGNLTEIVALQSGDVTISPKSSLCSPAMWQSHRNHRFAARQGDNFTEIIALQLCKRAITS